MARQPPHTRKRQTRQIKKDRVDARRGNPAPAESVSAGTPAPSAAGERGQDSPASPPTALPIHKEDRRFFLVMAWITVAAGLIVAGVVSFSTGTPHWGSAEILAGAAGMYVATLVALQAKPSAPRRSAPMILVCALLTWAAVGRQTWLGHHSPTQGATQAQLDKATSNAKATTDGMAAPQQRGEQSTLDHNICVKRTRPTTSCTQDKSVQHSDKTGAHRRRGHVDMAKRHRQPPRGWIETRD
jgi:hypothetical protein